jgi:hypothetical protein
MGSLGLDQLTCDQVKINFPVGWWHLAYTWDSYCICRMLYMSILGINVNAWFANTALTYA